MGSCLEAIESSVTTETALTSGLLSAEAVPLANLFRPNADGTPSMNLAYRPTNYPGAVVSLNDDEVNVSDVDKSSQNNGTALTWYSVPIYITVIATSDGTTAAEAR